MTLCVDIVTDALQLIIADEALDVSPKSWYNMLKIYGYEYLTTTNS